MPAFDPSALWNKSKAFIDRALRARDDSDDPNFHLWAALSLEILGKAALANIHPSLVADPNDQKSMFHACGIKSPLDTRSITAKTVFERLPQLSKEFDEALKKQCMLMANRRNAELHSGESPVVGLDQRNWVPTFWKASNVILAMQKKDLEDWVGVEEASRVRTILTDAAKLLEQSVASRIARRSAEYGVKFPVGSPDRQEAQARALARSAPSKLASEADDVEECDCPACSSKAWLLGYESHTEIIDSQEFSEDFGYWRTERVAIYYDVDGFYCSECGLTLTGRDEIGHAGLPEDFLREEEREPDYEPEYGND